MNKSGLLNWLQEEYRQWEALLDQIGPERIEQPGEFFDLFHDDHEPDVRVWLAQVEK